MKVSIYDSKTQTYVEYDCVWKDTPDRTPEPLPILSNRVSTPLSEVSLDQAKSPSDSQEVGVENSVETMSLIHWATLLNPTLGMILKTLKP